VHFCRSVSRWQRKGKNVTEVGRLKDKIVKNEFLLLCFIPVSLSQVLYIKFLFKTHQEFT